MSSTTISRDAGSRLASYIEDRRRQLVATVVQSSVLPRPGSIAAGAFANAFLDKLSQELEIGDRDIVDVWADAESHPDDAVEHARIVVLACATISAAYVADCGSSAEVVSYLAIRSSELEKRFRAERQRVLTATGAAKLISRDEVVLSLLSAIDARDPRTSEHSRAVGMWSQRLAKMLGMSSEVQAFAALCGTLHDVGKIATPGDVLLKPGPLDGEEWAAMRAHSRIGAKMLERIASLQELAPVVRAHHERMDGLGYPDGLAGEAIPIVARIVAVADSFHAMISKRPYRAPLSVPAAIDELCACSGTQFDPAVVRAMLDVVQPATAVRALRAAQGSA